MNLRIFALLFSVMSAISANAQPPVRLSDGRIVVFHGKYLERIGASGLSRYLPDGNRDTTFRVADLPYSDRLRAFTVHPGGTVYFALDDGRIGRLSGTGNYDHTWQPRLPRDIGFLADALHVDKQGRLVAVGSIGDRGLSYNLQSSASAVIRLLPDGSPDLNFASNGVLKFDLGSYHGAATSILECDVSKTLLIGGHVVEAGGNQAYVVRLTENGQMDRLYGHRGIAVPRWSLDFSDSSTASKLISARKANSPVAEIFLMGANFGSRPHGVHGVPNLVMKLDSHGNLDEDYYHRQLSSTPFAATDSYLRWEDFLFEHQEQKSLAFGVLRRVSGRNSNGTVSYQSMVVVGKLDSDGRLDRSFGTDGYRLYEQTRVSGVLTGLAAFPNALGRVTLVSSSPFKIWNLDRSGELVP